MKKNLLLTTILAFCFFAVNAQSQLIIDENFQDWEATEDTDPADCEAGLEPVGEYIIRTMGLTTTSGTVSIDVTMIKTAISPDCNTKRVNRGDQTENTPGVTTGFVQLWKTVEETDTIGEMVFGPISHIDSIRFGHSATGSDRGIRIYKSNNGIDWERATEDEFGDGDSQAGVMRTIEIDDTNVYIKFTSGIDIMDDISQMSRLHNLEVFGVPEEVVVGIKKENNTCLLKVYPIPATDYVILESSSDLLNSDFQIINILGETVYSSTIENQKLSIDLSNVISGVYFIQVTQNNNRYVNQLLVK